jgi:hypothetical protein
MAFGITESNTQGIPRMISDKDKKRTKFSREWAEKCEFGFELPSVVPNVQECTATTAVQKAA